MKSIIKHNQNECYICHKNGGIWGLDMHHVYNSAYRNKSEKYGLKVHLCHDTCHLNGVHKNHKLDLALKQHIQKIAMRHYGWSIEEFIKIFGRNYL